MRNENKDKCECKECHCHKDTIIGDNNLSYNGDEIHNSDKINWWGILFAVLALCGLVYWVLMVKVD